MTHEYRLPARDSENLGQVTAISLVEFLSGLVMAYDFDGRTARGKAIKQALHHAREARHIIEDNNGFQDFK